MNFTQGGSFTTADELTNTLQELLADAALIAASDPKFGESRPVINVVDGNGGPLTIAKLDVRTLSDGSRVMDIIIR